MKEKILIFIYNRLLELHEKYKSEPPKHEHEWESQMTEGLYADGMDYFYSCKCGALKRKYMNCEEEIIENFFSKKKGY